MDALQIYQDGGFPKQLTAFMQTKQPQMSIPAVDFSEEIDRSRHIGNVLNKELKIYVCSFYLFHVYFTVRCILYEIGGIKSVDALPEDPTFNQKDNKYKIASYQKNLW